jgi:hypothetical protein
MLDEEATEAAIVQLGSSQTHAAASSCDTGFGNYGFCYAG